MIYKAPYKNPPKRILQKVIQGLEEGKIYIFPTDTVYAFVCNFHDKNAVKRLYQLKKIPPSKPLALYCRDYSQASEYVRIEDNRIFRWMKAHLPGPYTLIFSATKKLPSYTLTKQKTVGIRIIDHVFVERVLEELGKPLIGTSVVIDGEYPSDVELLDKIYGKQVEAIIYAGDFRPEVSTVLDAREYPMEVLREGKGPILE